MQASGTTNRSIEWSEEEALLAKNASDVLAARSDMATVRKLLESPTGYDAAMHRELGELGWLGLALPEAYGGAGLPVSSLVGVVESMGRNLYASPFLAVTLAGQALALAGDAEQQRTWLPGLASGESIATLALFEPHGSFELDHIAASAEPGTAGFTLSGRKSGVLDAKQADLVLIAARLGGELSLFAATRAQLEDRVRAEVLIDETRRSARIDVDGLTLPASALLRGGDARAALLHVQRCAWLLSAAEMAGAAEGVHALTLDYLKTRKQFGKTIGSYQALKHPMVEIMCAIEQGRVLLYRAATAFRESDPEREIALRMAKAQLAATFMHACDRAIQFHGAIGFTYECHAQLYFRRAQWAQCFFGDVRHHHRHLAQLLLP